MAHPAARLITLILLLQSHPNRKAADLAAELGVSVRTLHRYINALEEMGIPVYAEHGPNGGFSLVRGYRLPPLVLTPDEAVAVHLGTGLVEELWGRLYREAARGALAKLDAVLPDAQRSETAWARRSLVTTGLNRSDLAELTPMLEQMRRAIFERRRLVMVYHNNNRPEATRRELDPYALVHRWGWWYAVGFCHLRKEVRSFRLDRIESLDMTDSKFAPPEHFDLNAFLAMDGEGQPRIVACMRFAPDFAHIAMSNRSYWDTLEVQPDNAVLVTFSAPDLYWAASTVLGYGPGVNVVGPETLRSLVHAWATEIVRQNAPTEGAGPPSQPGGDDKPEGMTIHGPSPDPDAHQPEL